MMRCSHPDEDGDGGTYSQPDEYFHCEYFRYLVQQQNYPLHEASTPEVLEPPR